MKDIEEIKKHHLDAMLNCLELQSVATNGLISKELTIDDANEMFEYYNVLWNFHLERLKELSKPNT